MRLRTSLDQTNRSLDAMRARMAESLTLGYALMMVPYLSWGTFALALDISVMQCDPSGESICPLSAAVRHNCAR